MIKPAIVSPTDDVTTITEVFDTRLVIKGRTGWPVIQLITWGILARIAKKRVPGRTWWQSIGIGALTMPVVLGSEWGHNLAHAYAAQKIGKPIDVIRILFGMPVLVYHNINDQTVSPREHIARALGGPIFNLTLLPIAALFRMGTDSNSIARDIADAAIFTNAFIPAVGLLPIPGIDGGPILKWSLVEKGHTIEEADMAVRKVNGVLGAGLAVAGVSSLKKKQWLLGGFLTLLSAIAISVATGLLKEQAE